MKEDITVMCGVSGGMSVKYFCVERGLCIGNMNFRHTYVRKYKKEARGRDGKEVMIQRCVKMCVRLKVNKRNGTRHVISFIVFCIVNLMYA